MQTSFESMFQLTGAVTILEKVARPILVYLFLVFLLRIFGKRELAQLNPFDLVVLLSLANTVQNAIIGDDTSVFGGMIGALSLCAFNYVVVRFLFQHRRLDQILEGTPTTLIEGGNINLKALSSELLTESELATVAHRQGFATLDQIERCVLEPGGTFFIEGKEPRGEELRQRELNDRIDVLARQIDELKGLILRQSTQSPST